MALAWIGYIQNITSPELPCTIGVTDSTGGPRAVTGIGDVAWSRLPQHALVAASIEAMVEAPGIQPGALLGRGAHGALLCRTNNPSVNSRTLCQFAYLADGCRLALTSLTHHL